MNQMRSKTGEAGPSRWPHPEYHRNDEPHFLFIVTPPYSGSTAIAKLLDSSDKTITLTDHGEGQWLVPGLCEKDRWEADKFVDYESVRAVWLSKYQDIKKRAENVEVVIEKSPPNMMRIERLSAQFKSCSFMANNRNPYASCASILYRQYDADNLRPEKRLELLEGLIGKWIIRSQRIRELMGQLDIPLVTYEKFCENPAFLVRDLQLPGGVAATVNPNAEIKVKDYEVQKIVNQNPRQISCLTGREIKTCSSVLEEQEELLAFYNYSIL